MGTPLPATWQHLQTDQRRDARQRRRMLAGVHEKRGTSSSSSRHSSHHSTFPSLDASLDPVTSARVAGLRYVNDDTMPGIQRVGQKTRIRYVTPNGRRVTDAADLHRIRALVIPPAWQDVWICPHANGHLQATGRDAKGRKQYRYHVRWREVRDEVKYGRLISFAQALPKIRERTDRDLSRPGLPREKVLAAVVQLLEKTLIRVGNEEYARTNGSVGLTTMRDGHAKIQGTKVRFEFRGKSGVQHAINLDDRRLAKIVKACRDLPGYELFQYLDEDGSRQEIDSADVNAYLREISSEDFTAKDFRTWAGTVLAAQALAAVNSYKSNAEAKRNVVKAIESVAKRLGNTKAVCRKCYIHPAILDAYMDGGTIQTIKARARLAKSGSANNGSAKNGSAKKGAAKKGAALSAEEVAVVRIIERRLRKKTA